MNTKNVSVALLVSMLLAAVGCSGFESTEYSQAGWRIKSDKIDLFVTENGGQLAPVRCDVGADSPVQPYYISPWQNEGLTGFGDPILVPLRGNWFGMPFGGNGDDVNGENHPAHGEVSSSKWSFVDATSAGGITTLTLGLETKVRPGRVTKKLSLVDGQNVIYTSHKIEGNAGKMSVGYHCTLNSPQEKGSLRIATSAFEFAMTCPTVFSDPAGGAYQALALGDKFTDLTKAPTRFKDAPTADVSAFPLRTGYADLVQLVRKPSATPSWTAATCQSKGYLWFSLKDASVMPSTLFWIANKGRHDSPWNGRNRCLGLEELCGFFAEGLGGSSKSNAINQAGFPTTITLDSDKPTTINFIEGAVGIPTGFKNVKTARFGDKKVTFISTTGKEVVVNVNYDFLNTGKL